MAVVFEGLLPVFLLIGLGTFIKYIKLIPVDNWGGLERLSFFVFVPALMINALYKADFSQISFGGVSIAFLVGMSFTLLAGIAIRTQVKKVFSIDDPAFSSIYQGFTRWNPFVALAVVEKLYGSSGMTIVILGMAVMTVPINVVNVLVVGWLGNREGKSQPLIKTLLLNPIILATILGLLLNFFGLKLHVAAETTLGLLSDATLPLALVLVGAGLQLTMKRNFLGAALFGTAMRLLAGPAIIFVIGLWFGITGNDLVVMTICGGVPTAMSGFLLARQMGGDAPLHATIATMQTALSFVTLYLVILVAQSLADRI
ncbi:MAG: AEC family transporter [Rhizobiaceae bacterium]